MYDKEVEQFVQECKEYEKVFCKDFMKKDIDTACSDTMDQIMDSFVVGIVKMVFFLRS